MESTLIALNRIGEQGAQAAESGRADSRTLKALTLTATMYLPATLLAVVKVPSAAFPLLRCWNANSFGARLSSALI
jgi:hypothetical protein